VTTYYISPYGSDSNNGLGPDPTDSTNKPWLTLSKAMQTGTPLTPGGIVRIAPGTYYSTRSVVPDAGISSVGSPTQLIGDPTNTVGFRDSGGNRLPPGLPHLTSRTSGEGIDGTAAGSYNTIDASAVACSGLQYRQLQMSCSRALMILAGTLSTDILIDDCIVFCGGLWDLWGGWDTTAGRNWTIQRSHVFAPSGILYGGNVDFAAHTADADLNIRVENNLWDGAFVYSQGFSSAGGNLAGGIYIYDNTVRVMWPNLNTLAGRVSTVKPIKFGRNTFIGASGVDAGTAGQIIDDGYNRFVQTSAEIAGFTNVTQAGTTIRGVMPNIVLPHLVKWGLDAPRPDFLCWTDAAHANQKFSASGAVTADFRGRTIRPWGAGASIGCWQVPNVAQDTSSAITGGGVNSLKFTGAGESSHRLAVNAQSTTISVKTKSTSYGGANYPQLVVVANPSIGITADQTGTATDATEQTVSVTFTPTAKGVVEVRLVSRSSSGSSATYFDRLLVG